MTYAGAAFHFWLPSVPASVGGQEQISSASWTLPPLMTLIQLAKAVLRTRLASFLFMEHTQHSHRVHWRGTQAPHTSSSPTLRVLEATWGATRPFAQHEWGDSWAVDTTSGLQASLEASVSATWTLSSSPLVVVVFLSPVLWKIVRAWSPACHYFGTSSEVVSGYALVPACQNAGWEAKQDRTLDNFPEPSGSGEEMTLFLSPEKWKICRNNIQRVALKSLFAGDSEDFSDTVFLCRRRD